MTDYTEQWNKGKLPEGDYYIKRRNGYLPYDNIDSHGIWRNSIDEDIIEVLAPVPDYEEWQAKLEENAYLKELLKEIRSKIKTVYDFDTREFTNCAEYENDLLTKIDEVLK